MGGSLDIPANPVRDRQFGYDESTADRTVGNSAERLSGETVLAVPRLKNASTPTSDRLRVTASSGYPQSGEPDPLWVDDHRGPGLPTRRDDATVVVRRAASIWARAGVMIKTSGVLRSSCNSRTPIFLIMEWVPGCPVLLGALGP